jgi:hypothetical protein
VHEDGALVVVCGDAALEAGQGVGDRSLRARAAEFLPGSM